MTGFTVYGPGGTGKMNEPPEFDLDERINETLMPSGQVYTQAELDRLMPLQDDVKRLIGDVLEYCEPEPAPWSSDVTWNEGFLYARDLMQRKRSELGL